MKSLSLILILLTASAFAQEEEPSGWKVMPGVTIVKYLPGGHRQSMNPQPLNPQPMENTAPGFIPMQQANRYSGTGVSLNARFFNEDINPFVLTFSGGANWYSVSRGREPFGPPNGGITPMENGDPMFARQDRQFERGRNGRGFMSFPFGAGVQFVYPWKSVDKFMFFAGAEGNLVFTTIEMGMRDRVQPGYTLLGGVALKFVEIGVRYTAFRESKNLGVQLGFRLNSFEL